MSVRQLILLPGVAAAALVAAPMPLAARAIQHKPAAARLGFTVLGTNAGAIPNPTRMQPANALVAEGGAILVDSGDGAATQLAKVGISLRQVDAVLISHLHLDHTGGLFALIGQRFQIQERSKLSVFGPPGTRALVSELCEALGAAAQGTDLLSYGSQACEGVSAVDLNGGQVITLHGIKVTAAENSHYTTSERKSDARSFSFRFDIGNRTLVYTGDTGPSAAVEALSRDADILLSEVVEPDLEMAEVRRSSPKLSADMLSQIDAHMRQDHLSPGEVGKLAHNARAKRLVLTHISFDRADLPRVLAEIARYYSGPVIAAEDLQEF